MPRLQSIATDAAAKPAAHYSQAVVHDGIVYTAGAIGIDPATGAFAEGVGAQTTRALENLAAVLEAAGSDLTRVLKATCYLANPEDFLAFNEAYATVLDGTPPPRTTVGVRFPDPNLLVEIELIAAQ